MKKTAMALVLMAMLVGWVALPSAATTEHCPDHNSHPGKVQGGDLNDIVLDAGVSFCVKGSTDATGVLTADGETTLVEYLDNGHDVSYYVVYESDDDDSSDDDDTSDDDDSSSDVTTPTTPQTTPTTDGGSRGVIVTTTTLAPCYDGEARNDDDVCTEVSNPVAVTTTTVPESTTTTVAPVVTNTLPFTGAGETLPLAVGGLLLALSGLGLVLRVAKD